MIYRLSDPQAQDARIAGGKASSLARLLASGFPVPDGFVVVADGDAELSNFLSAAGGGKFAVRSSGFAEDSSEASFAGQFETFLGVDGDSEVASAVTRCFSSFTNERSGSYRKNKEVDRSGGAVLVQKLVRADAAGIAFTIDPVTGDTDSVLIESNFGLGESVVSGHVTPDRFRVSKKTGQIVERAIGDKEKRTTLVEIGTRLEPLPTHLRAVASIPDDIVCAIAALACEVEKLYGQPVDVEWAMEEGRLFLLQARPVTAVGATLPPKDWMPELNSTIDPRFPLYSCGNVSEILPGCVTPLTYSLFVRGVEKAFRSVAESLGSMPDVGPKPIVVGFFFHRVYLNASYFMTAADNSPGATRDTVYEELIGPPETRTPAFTWRDALPWNAFRGLRIITRFLSMQKRVGKDIAQCRARYEETRKLLQEKPPSALTNAELATRIASSDEDLEPAILHIRVSQFATSSFSALKDQTRKLFGDTNGSLGSTLVTGIGSLASANPSRGLYELAQDVLKDSSLRALFDKHQNDHTLLEELRSTSFQAKLDAFIVNYGHRGFREAEFRNPCWRQDPASVISHIRKHLEPGSTPPDEIAARQAAQFERARAEAVGKLSGVKRTIFESILANARKHIAAREETKDLVLRFLDLNRLVLAEAQTRLRDVLENPQDLYMLLDSEVAAALRGDMSREQAMTIVRRRERDMEFSSRIYVPKIQNGTARFMEQPEARVSGAKLVGVPVSPGYVEGRARVVMNPAEATLSEGEILVAPVTDVAWTPLFLRAKGLVVEVGGPLSHGSIVAREFGIPAVTSIAGATKTIRNGDLLRVDGSQGIVVIVEEERRENS
jgi:phosphohistidine swiveling domain-containing protein